MLKDKTNITKIGNHGRYFLIPSILRNDSQFPFSEEDELEMVIDSEVKEVRIKKKEDETNESE